MRLSRLKRANMTFFNGKKTVIMSIFAAGLNIYILTVIMPI